MKQLQHIGFYLLELCIKIAIMLLIFSTLRALFLIHNSAHFPNLSFSNYIFLFANSLRFDLSALCYVNLLLIVSYLLPIPFRQDKRYRKIQHWLFVTFNGLAIVIEITDIAYFPFILRRTNAGDLSMAGNTSDLLPLFLREYWYLIILFVFLLLFLVWSFRKWGLPYPTQKQSFLSQVGVLLIGAVLTFIGLRGGIQLRPLMPISAQQFVPDMQLAPLVYPGTLSFLFSTQQRFLNEINYFEEEELKQIFPIHRQHNLTSSPSQKQNVVVIILESFGQEYSSLLSKDKNGYMPFLDSLIGEGYYYEHSFASGLRSTQGIAAISASLPSLMEDPYMFSAYQTNQLDGIANLLKKDGYTSCFFHGANPGSMELEDFSRLCGFDYYFDRSHYNNDADYDGYWGIWDRPFFQYAAKVLDSLQRPFYAQLFSLTSHHPYKVEPFYEKLQPKAMPMYRSVRYTDFALRQFFQTASKMPWFDNTLFVITADHTGLSRVFTYQTRIGRYKIPLLLYKPNSDLKGQQKGIAQQIDILPSILDYLDYNKPFTSFGKSMLDTGSHRYAYMYQEQSYQILDEQFILLFDGNKSFGMYDHVKDYRMQHDLMQQFPIDRMRLEKQLKAVIQQHHNSLIRNELGN